MLNKMIQIGKEVARQIAISFFFASLLFVMIHFFFSEKINTYLSLINMMTIVEKQVEKQETKFDSIEKRLVNYPSWGSIWATIKIPDIGVEAPVYHGDTLDIIKYGVGHYSGSYFPGEGGTIILAAHNSKQHFMYLPKLKEGAEVIIEASYGTFTYRLIDTKIIGEKEMVLYLGEEFKDPGANATLKEQDISKKIKINGKVNCNKIGTYSLKYSISNSKGKNTKTITRQITVIDNVKPVITLKKDTVLVGYKENFKDPGYTAIDNYDGDITNKVEVVGKVDTSKLGTYELSYIVSDSSNNRTIAKRKVKVIDNTAPRITLKGEKRVVLNLNQPFQEPGYTAIDDLDGDVTKNVKVSKSINSKNGSI